MTNTQLSKDIPIDTSLWTQELKKEKIDKFADISIKQLEEYSKNTLNENYKKAINILVYDFLFWENKNKILAVPMPTGSGKSTISEVTLANMYNDELMKRYCGTIILKLQIEDCNSTADNINKFAGKDIAYAYHSGEYKEEKSYKIDDDTLFTYPILIMTHEGFKALVQRHEEKVEEGKKKKGRKKKYISELLSWTDKKIDKLTVNYNIFDRNRLIIDEEISNVEPIQVGMNSINTLRNCILNMGNNKLYDKFTEFIKKVEKEFIKPYNESANKIFFTYFENMEVPDGLDEAIYDSKDFKAREIYINLLNLLEHGGYRHYSDNKDYKNITTYKYINIFDSRFKKIQLDATANVNPLYKFNPNYEVQILPEFKTYKNTYIHIFDKITGSRASINENYENGLLEACYKDIEKKLENNEKALIIFNNKDLEFKFYEQMKEAKLFKDHRVWLTHYGMTTGSNKWKDYDKVFVIGINILNDACYPLFYFCNSQEEDFNKYDTTLVPKKGGRRYAEEKFEEVRKGMVTASMIQAINRIKIRRYENGDTPETHIYIINSDKDIDNVIAESMKGVNILYDWDLDYKTIEKEDKRKTSVVNNTQRIIDGLKFIVENPQDEFIVDLINKNIINDKGIKKKDLRELLEFKTRDTFNKALDSPLFIQFCEDYKIDISNKKNQYINITIKDK